MEDIEQFEKKVKDFKNSYKNSSSKKKKKPHKPFHVGLDIISSVIAGCFIGIVIDKIFLTKPIFMVICLFLGFFGGLRNIYKSITK
jgi:F0F1-type ATP synthase assembly protein I